MTMEEDEIFLTAKKDFEIIKNDEVILKVKKGNSYEFKYIPWDLEYFYQISSGLHKQYLIKDNNGRYHKISLSTTKNIFNCLVEEVRNNKLNTILRNIRGYGEREDFRYI